MEKLTKKIERTLKVKKKANERKLIFVKRNNYEEKFICARKGKRNSTYKTHPKDVD